MGVGQRGLQTALAPDQVCPRLGEQEGGTFITVTHTDIIATRRVVSPTLPSNSLVPFTVSSSSGSSQLSSRLFVPFLILNKFSALRRHAALLTLFPSSRKLIVLLVLYGIYEAM